MEAIINSDSKELATKLMNRLNDSMTMEANLTEDDIFILKNWNKIEKLILVRPISLRNMKRVINKIRTKQ